MCMNKMIHYSVMACIFICIHYCSLFFTLQLRYLFMHRSHFVGLLGSVAFDARKAD